MTSEQARGIQSLEIGLSVLRSLQTVDGPVSLKELSVLTGLASSKLHRYCASLARAGFAVQDTRGVYRAVSLGDLGQTSAKSSRLKDILSQISDFVRTVEHSAFVSEWKLSGPAIIHIEESIQPVSVRPRTDGPSPVLTSATGQAFLAFCEPNLKDQFLSAELDRSFPSITFDQKRARIKEFEKKLKAVKGLGLSCSKGSHIKGISSFAAPVMICGSAKFVVTSYGISETFDTSSRSPIAKSLLSFVRNLSD
jgi:DNA-binding IclR family transcriptional regulator